MLLPTETFHRWQTCHFIHPIFYTVRKYGLLYTTQWKIWAHNSCNIVLTHWAITRRYMGKNNTLFAYKGTGNSFAALWLTTHAPVLVPSSCFLVPWSLFLSPGPRLLVHGSLFLAPTSWFLVPSSQVYWWFRFLVFPSSWLYYLQGLSLLNKGDLPPVYLMSPVTDYY